MVLLQVNQNFSNNINLKAIYLQFYEAFISNEEYDSSQPNINKVEEFLIYWLNGEPYENIEGHLEALYERFKGMYPYPKTVYRGIEIKASQTNVEELRDNYLTSFTDQVEVAKHFAGVSKEYGNKIDLDSTSFLIETKIPECFALDRFLLRLIEITNNIDLQIVIEERIWENEKIAFFQKEQSLISLINKAGY